MKWQIVLLAVTLALVSAKPSSLRKDNNVAKATQIIKANPRSPLRANPSPIKQKSPQPPKALNFLYNEAKVEEKQVTYQALQLFTEHGQAGLTATLYAEYCGDLGACFEVNLDNTMSSARVFGIWLFYDGYSYGLNDDLDVAWVWGDDAYYDFDELDNAVSSVRFVGPEDNFYGDSITLFSSENFKAWEYFVFADSSSLPGWDYLTDSAIVTGSTSWTLYELEFYQGESVCLSPDQNQNPGLYPTVSSVGLDTVRSMRRGCFSKTQQKPLEIQKNVLYSSKNL